MSNNLGIIWSDKRQVQVATNGFHTGTLYNGKECESVFAIDKQGCNKFDLLTKSRKDRLYFFKRNH